MPPRFMIPLIAGLAFAGPLLAADGTPKGVVELFTSQGCSSCPPADAAFRKLVSQGNVIALAYHVDYWNYLGWADTLSSKENTARQYGYARMMGRSNVYTPQAIVNGRDHLAGADLAGINMEFTRRIAQETNDQLRGFADATQRFLAGTEHKPRRGLPH